MAARSVMCYGRTTLAWAGTRESEETYSKLSVEKKHNAINYFCDNVLRETRR